MIADFHFSNSFHTQTVLLNILYWLIALAPGLPIPLIYLAYRKILANKREALSSLMAQDGVFASYQKRFGKAGETADKVVKQLFTLYYGPVTYVLPIIMNVVVIALIVSAAARSSDSDLPVASRTGSYNTQLAC